MIKSYYISPMRSNAQISETIIPGYHITVGGNTYELVSKRPRNKIIKFFSNESIRLSISGPPSGGSF